MCECHQQGGADKNQVVLPAQQHLASFEAFHMWHFPTHLLVMALGLVFTIPVCHCHVSPGLLLLLLAMRSVEGTFNGSCLAVFSRS